ncbi:MAG: hypothetical protein M1449_09365, partial [Candidatus Thermoplasmatota archaeon]|nr:hypothetical protein [Candidatus Thermoplasmatota archaeon]
SDIDFKQGIRDTGQRLGQQPFPCPASPAVRRAEQHHGDAGRGEQNWKAGGAALARIRRLIGINLSLGLLTIAVVFLGRGLA